MKSTQIKNPYAEPPTVHGLTMDAFLDVCAKVDLALRERKDTALVDADVLRALLPDPMKDELWNRVQFQLGLRHVESDV